ncbi:MAG: HAMP domain-containing histidine kinase [Sphingomonadales bacterium]|nr:HAMP domain-containing histidine kinase [Sphingomonadales bacterium]MDE2172099.1 HAMP domain-containing histidine kinase [Sphingomonadales bacterium]
MLDERRRSRALSSGAFRFALLLSGLFASGSALLLWTVQHQINHYATEATNALLRNESAALAGEYRTEGVGALVDAIAQRKAAPGGPFEYLVLDRAGRRLAGDLPMSASMAGWRTGFVQDPGGQPEEARFLGVTLPQGGLLVVATDAFDIRRMRDRLEAFTLASGVLISLAALIGGGLAGRLFVARLDRINRSIDLIMAGGSAERLPAIGVGPEFDDLVHNLNRMLDRNVAAMEGLRQVSTAIAHDLRTPLSRLKQHLEGMRNPAQRQPVAIDQAVDQIDDVLHTFQALLRIGMLEGGVGRQRFSSVDLAEVMERVCQAYEPVAEDQGFRLTVDHVDHAMVTGDRDLLTQLFSNLIENVLTHTPPGTLIASSLTVSDGVAVAVIADDGPGIDEEDREHVFERFYRADGARATPGAGLGLSLVAAIAELHGGQCRLLPTMRGVAVEMKLPIAGSAEST